MDRSVRSVPLAIGWSQLRRRWRAWVAMALLVTLAGGAALGAAAGARRTASLVTRFRRDAAAPDLVVDDDQPISYAHLPGVVSESRSAGLAALRLGPGGRPDFTGIDQVLASVDGRYLATDRPAVAKGRLPDPRRADEGFLDEDAARRTGLHVGDRITVVGFRADQVPSTVAGFDAGRRTTIRIVGIGTMTDEVVQDDVAREHRLVLTPAFWRRATDEASFRDVALRLAPGASTTAVEREVTARSTAYAHAHGGAAAASGELSFADERAGAARMRRAIRPTALALGLFAALAGLVTVVVAGQATARLIRRDAADVATLRALGLTTRQLVAALSVGPVVAGSAGIVGALGVAVALSPLAPLGAGRAVEPHPGISLDLVAVVAGAAVLAVLLTGRAILSVVGALGSTRAGALAPAAASERGVPPVAARAVGPTASIGLGLAVAPGAGRVGAARTTLLGVVVAVAAFALTVTFGSGLSGLVHQPRRYGWNWDAALQLSGGYGRLDAGGFSAAHAITPAGLRVVPGVAAASSTRFEVTEVDGIAVPTVALRPFVGRVDLALASGRPATASDEVVLGTTTARQLHVGVGDEVTIRAAGRLVRALVTGTAVFPALGRIDTERTGLGVGVELTGAGLDALAPCRTYANTRCHVGGGDNGLVIAFRPGADRAATLAALRRRYDDGFSGATILGAQRSADIVDEQHLGAIPAALAALLGLAAVGTLAQSLAATVRQRRRDLAVLKAMGFTRRQVSATVAWQATATVVVAIVIGFPLGVAAGRQLWVRFADQVGVLPDPATPFASLALAAALAVVVANAVAGLPALAAGRLRPADALRSE